MKKIILKTNQNNPDIKAYKQAIEKGKQDHHVVYKENSWIITRGGSNEIINSFGTQQEAITQAKSIAQNQGTSVYIHGTDGRIKETVSYESNSYHPSNVSH